MAIRLLFLFFFASIFGMSVRLPDPGEVDQLITPDIAPAPPNGAHTPRDLYLN